MRNINTHFGEYKTFTLYFIKIPKISFVTLMPKYINISFPVRDFFFLNGCVVKALA